MGRRQQARDLWVDRAAQHRRASVCARVEWRHRGLCCTYIVACLEGADGNTCEPGPSGSSRTRMPLVRIRHVFNWFKCIRHVVNYAPIPIGIPRSLTERGCGDVRVMRVAACAFIFRGRAHTVWLDFIYLPDVCPNKCGSDESSNVARWMATHITSVRWAENKESEMDFVKFYVMEGGGAVI